MYALSYTLSLSLAVYFQWSALPRSENTHCRGGGSLYLRLVSSLTGFWFSSFRKQIFLVWSNTIPLNWRSAVRRSFPPRGLLLPHSVLTKNLSFKANFRAGANLISEFYFTFTLVKALPRAVALEGMLSAFYSDKVCKTCWTNSNSKNT